MTTQDARIHNLPAMMSARFAMVLLALLSVPCRADTQALRDSVIVQEVVSPTPLQAGVPSYVDVLIRVTVESMDRGLARFGFNSASARDVRLQDSVALKRGVTDTVVRLSVIPVDWGSQSGFYLLAALGPYHGDSGWMPVSRTRVALPLSQGETATPEGRSSGAANQPMRNTAGSTMGDSLDVSLSSDGAEIRRGRPAAFVFRIRAKLQSAERAAVAVSFNTTAANSFMTMATLAIERGTSDHDLRVTVAPVDWSPDHSFGTRVSIVRVNDRGERVGGPSLLSTYLPVSVAR